MSASQRASRSHAVENRDQKPAMDRHLEMMREHHESMLWTNFTNVFLGLWLVSSPFTFGYTSAAMTASDVAAGILLSAFAAGSFSLRFDHARWGVCAVGLWLLFAPLALWAPDASAYLNDTLVGTLALGLSVLVPMMPGMAHHMAMMEAGPDVPRGWTYNPSSWPQRAPMIALALVGLLVSRYLAAFQLGYIDRAWDPFFGPGSERVLTSEVSRMWPISDAGLGALAYTLEALMGFMGDARRWRTMPWMCLFFFILVVPLGITHVVLVISQPVAVGAWCTLCLLAAAIMLAMIPLAVDEVFAMFQFLGEARGEGKPLWRTFWAGGTIRKGQSDCRTPRLSSRPSELAPSMVWGVSASPSLVASAALAIWLIVSPDLMGSTAAAADSDHLAGALLLTTSVITMAEVIRVGRFLNLPTGLWVAAAPWLVSGASTIALVNDLVVGLAVAILAIPRGPIRERYARADRFIF